MRPGKMATKTRNFRFENDLQCGSKLTDPLDERSTDKAVPSHADHRAKPSQEQRRPLPIHFMCNLCQGNLIKHRFLHQIVEAVDCTEPTDLLLMIQPCVRQVINTRAGNLSIAAHRSAIDCSFKFAVGRK